MGLRPGHDAAPRTFAWVNPAIRARVRIAIDEDASGVSGTIGLAAVNGVRAQQKHGASLHQHGLRLAVEERIHRRSALLQVLMAPATATRNDHQRAVFLIHDVDRDDRLHETAAAIHVGPLFGPVAAMVAILVPSESDPVGGQFEVGLADQLLHLAAAQELARRDREPRVLAVRQQHGLGGSTPDDAIDPVIIDDEVGALDHPGPGQFYRRLAEPVKSLADFPDFSVAKDSRQNDIAFVVERFNLRFAQAGHGVLGKFIRALPGDPTRDAPS